MVQVSLPTPTAQSPAICPTPRLGTAIVTAPDITAGGSAMSQGPIVALQGESCPTRGPLSTPPNPIKQGSGTKEGTFCFKHV